MEVRLAYADADFEWESLRRLAVAGTRSSNVALMRRAAYASLAAGDAGAGGGGVGGGGGGA